MRRFKGRAVVLGFVGLLPLLSGAFAEASAADPAPYSPLPPPPPPDSPARPAPRVPAPAPKVAPAPAPPPPSSAPAATTPGSSTESVPVRERARPALEDDRFSAALLLGFGTNNLELGLGVRAGAVAFVPHLWFGGTFMFHNGTSSASTVGNVQYASSASLIYLGPEVGYDFEVGPIVIRPFGGVGPGLFRASSTTGAVRASDNTTRFLLWTGGAALYGFPNTRFFVGGDMRLITVPLGPAFALYGFGGITF